jgi:hypothetical protein
MFPDAALVFLLFGIYNPQKLAKGILVFFQVRSQSRDVRGL